MPVNFLLHVTLMTGDRRRSSREEVAADDIAALLPLLERALAGEAVPLPAPSEGAYCLTAAGERRCMIATVTAAHAAGPSPLVTFGVAAHSLCGARLWRLMHRDRLVPLATDVRRVPPAPWIAVTLHPGLSLDLDAARWLGDFERCLGWVWLARHERAH